MSKDDKITDGLNDRPRNETIGQSGPGIPDDSSEPIVVDDEAVERARQSLMKLDQRKAKQPKID
ncbi:hypothetical protein EPK99_13595 [Neorhizobium lilium]|uniref:Uncharacterized protein n=1 Tax=Neorhizobium lilium TaxID=2503024 RepID=A0A444LEV0_9HYPH|nr:hypothetical protein [Neorhizobium lilium]RWX76707.1 hypothetical protein EPK99_13595 [Neorhizobium lilium]